MRFKPQPAAVASDWKMGESGWVVKEILDEIPTERVFIVTETRAYRELADMHACSVFALFSCVVGKLGTRG